MAQHILRTTSSRMALRHVDHLEDQVDQIAWLLHHCRTIQALTLVEDSNRINNLDRVHNLNSTSPDPVLNNSTRDHLHLSRCPTSILHQEMAVAMNTLRAQQHHRVSSAAYHLKNQRTLDTNHISPVQEAEGGNLKDGIQSSNDD